MTMTEPGAGLLDPGRPVIEVYEAGLRATMRGDRAGWRVRHDDGRSADLPLAAWAGAQRLGDLGLLARCLGPTVDLGCGPGRLTSAANVRIEVGSGSVPWPGIDNKEPLEAT